MLERIINELLYCLTAMLTALMSHAIVDSILLLLSIQNLWIEIIGTMVLWAILGTAALKYARKVFEDETDEVE